MSPPDDNDPHSTDTATATDYEATVARLEAQIARIDVTLNQLTEEQNTQDTSSVTLARRKQVGEEISFQQQFQEQLERRLARFRKLITDQHQESKSGPTARTDIPGNLPKFRLGSGSVDDPNEFIFQYKRALDLAGLDANQHGRRLIPYCFNSDLSEWAESNLDATMDWETLKTVFLDGFGDPDREYKACRELREIRMMPGESLILFSQRFLKLMRSAKLPDPESGNFLSCHYRECLPLEVQFQIDAELRKRGRPQLSVQQMASIATMFRWNESAPARGGGPTSVGGKTRSTLNRKHCQLHGIGYHSTEQCRTLQARKGQEDPKAADAQPAPSTQAMDPFRRVTRSQTATAKPTCGHCQKVGHVSAECPDNKPVVQSTTVEEATDDPTPNAGTTTDGVRYYEHVRLNGEEHLALLDTGANKTFISTSLAAKLGVAIEATVGDVDQTVKGTEVTRIGVTAPIRVQFETADFSCRCEVLPEMNGAQILLGADVLSRPQIIGPRFHSHNHNHHHEDNDAAPPEDGPVSLVAPEYDEEEQTPEFQAYRKTVAQAIKPVLDANAATPRSEFCPIPEAEVHLPTDAGKVTFRRQYALPQLHRAIVDAKLAGWLRDGVVEIVKTPSEFNTPLFLIEKKDPTGAKTDARVCHDFRLLNQLLPSDHWPLPLVSEIFDAVAGAQVFSTLDLRQAYHRFPIAVEDRHKTAFTWNGTHYQFRGAPFGLKTLPSQFQRVMAMLLFGLDYARVFIDDIVVFSKSRDDHAAHLTEVIRRLNDAKLILNIDKCHFARLEINLLGFRINPYGQKIDPSRLVNLADWPVPTTAKQVRSFLGFVNYLRGYVPKISTLAAPLNAIRLKDSITAQWTPACAHAFQALKEVLLQSPPLAHPDFERPFSVATDASAVGIGAALYQWDSESNTPRYIQFQARALSKSERNYSATKRELLAIVFAFQRFHHYIYGYRFTLYTDHKALTHIHTQPRLNAMMESWRDQLFAYDYDVVHRPGIHNVLPDRLSRLFPPSDVEGEGASDKPAVNTLTTAAAPQPRATVRKATTTDDDRRPARKEPPPEQRADIILRHHLRGHFGVKAVIASVREEGLDWPNLANQVQEVCSKCIPCQRHNIAKRGYHPLSPISADQPFDHVAIDLAGPFPTSPRGNHYLFVLVDIHSRFVWLRAIPDKRSATVGAALFEVFTTLGFPKVVQSDNGTEFVNAALKHLFTQAKVDHRLVTPYHPRANGIAERTVQTATTAIKKLLDGAHGEWDIAVPFVQFAINTKVAAIHKSTPFAVAFGRGPNQLTHFDTTDGAPATADDVEARVQFMQEALFPGIAELARASQGTMKSAFDATHAQVDIPIDASVMLRDQKRRRKLDPRFEGPYRVIGKSGNAYTLQDNTGALLPRTYPPSAIKVISTDLAYDAPSYEVEAILNHRDADHGREYLVRWKGYSEKDDSWEPVANFDDESTITDYWTRRANSNGRRQARRE